MRKKTKIALCYQRIKSKKDTKPVFVKPMYEAPKLMNAYQNHGSNCGSARPRRALVGRRLGMRNGEVLDSQHFVSEC